MDLKLQAFATVLGDAGAQSPGPRDGVVLVVEDDLTVQETVADILARDGFRVVCADSLNSAEDRLRTSDVMIALVDITLRDGNGLELVKRLSLDPLTSTIIMSGRSEDMDRIIGLEVGADDYVTKPFNGRELAARLRRHATRVRYIREHAGAKRSSRPADPGTSIGHWTIDEARRAVYDGSGARADLSDSEFRTLLAMARKRGSVLTRDALYREVVGPGARDPFDRRIDVYVSALRKKLKLTDPHRIRTVHGIGYIVD